MSMPLPTEFYPFTIPTALARMVCYLMSSSDLEITFNKLDGERVTRTALSSFKLNDPKSDRVYYMEKTDKKAVLKSFNAKRLVAWSSSVSKPRGRN